MFKILFSLILAIAGTQAMAQTTTAVNEVTPEMLQSYVPKTYLRFWNSYAHQRGNNCYNYATNRVTNSFAQPGQASGERYTSLTCAAVHRAAAADLGLEPVAYWPYNGKEDDLLIALVVAPNFDYHWYRRDSNGRWSHKPGLTRATIHDNAGDIITDPETADRGPYSDFCGYFRVKNFANETHEQNGGYVRVGNMTALPDLSEDTTAEDPPAAPIGVEGESYVEVQMYAGRENPRIALTDYFSRPANADIISKVVPEIQASIRDISRQNLEVPEKDFKLGSQNIRIHDAQGLLFPVGTRVELRSGDAVVTLPNRESFSVKVPEASRGTEY